MMEKMINLPNMDAIHEFVQHARETGDMVLVTKDGFKVIRISVPLVSVSDSEEEEEEQS